MQAKDIPDAQILNFLANRQGSWTSYWGGYFETEEFKAIHPYYEKVEDVFFAFTKGTPENLARYKLKSLYNRGLIGGCICGCRGDFEITDKGLALIGRERTKPYTGY